MNNLRRNLAKQGSPPPMRGKVLYYRLSSTSCAGSPPPMRGKGLADETREYRTRITPAYAGKRYSPAKYPAFSRDHPRLCGEKSRYRVTLWITAGSPPPMRGKAEHFSQHTNLKRITPAYAGKSFFPAGSLLRHRDHPRLCGEKAICS